jgi:hypothetical protein
VLCAVQLAQHLEDFSSLSLGRRTKNARGRVINLRGPTCQRGGGVLITEREFGGRWWMSCGSGRFTAATVLQPAKHGL